MGKRGVIHTVEEVARARCAAEPDVHSDADRERCEIGAEKRLRRIATQWTRVQFKVGRLDTAWRGASCDSSEIGPYVAMRQQGSPFPAVIVQPGKGRLPGVKWITHDGNHRVRAAECVGDEYIDAFVPVKRRGLAAAPEVEPLIQAKERELVHLPVEHGALYEQDGRLLWHKKGRSRAVLKLTPEEVAQFPDRIFTHNHPTVHVKGQDPSGADALRVVGSSLSPVDVVMAAKHDLAEVRAVTRMVIDGQERTVVYRIERPRGGWPSWRTIDDEMASFEAGQKVRLKHAHRAGPAAYQHALATSMDEGWRERAPLLGLKYESMVLDGASLGAVTKRRRVVRAYHGTSCTNAASIQRNGITIDPNNLVATSPRWWMLAKDKVSSSFHAPSEDGCLVELEIPVENLPPRKWPGWPWLWPAHKMEWDGKPTAWYALREPVPAEFVKNVTPIMRRRPRR